MTTARRDQDRLHADRETRVRAGVEAAAAARAATVQADAQRVQEMDKATDAHRAHAAAELDQNGQIAGQMPLPATVAGPVSAPVAGSVKGARRCPGQTLVCGWCGGPLALRATGRTRKWCSDSCRRRAWETSHAVATGAVGVRVVDRQVEVQVPVQVPVIERVEVETHPKGAEWVEALRVLTQQLATGRPPIYDRDLPAIEAGLVAAATALYARQSERKR